MLNLYDWWFSDITQEERLIIQTFLDNNPLGISYNSLIIGDDSDELDTFVNGEPLGDVSIDTLLNGELTYAPAKKRQVHLLTMISNYLEINKDSALIIKLLNKAESFSDSTSFIDRHFLYSNLIKNYSKQSESKLYEFYLLKMVSISKQTALEFKNEYKNSPLPVSLGIDGWYEYLIKNQRVEEALNLYNEGINYMPEHVKAYYWRAWFFALYLSKYDEAISDFSKAIKLEPKNPHWLLNRSKIYHVNGDLKSAKNDINEAVKISKE